MFRRVLSSSPPVEAIALEDHDASSGGTRGHRIHVVDATAGHAQIVHDGRFYGARSSIFSCALSEEALFIASGTACGKILVHDARDNRLLCEMQAHIDVVSGLAFAPPPASDARGGGGGRGGSSKLGLLAPNPREDEDDEAIPAAPVLLVSCSLDSQVRFWRCRPRMRVLEEVGVPPSRQPRELQASHHKADVNCVCVPFSRAHLAISGADDLSLRFWTWTDDEKIGIGGLFTVTHVEDLRGASARCIRASEAGFIVAAGLSNGTIVVMDLRKSWGSKIVCELDGGGGVAAGSFCAPVLSLAFLPSSLSAAANADDAASKGELVCGDAAGQLRFFELENGFCTSAVQLYGREKAGEDDQDEERSGTAVASIVFVEYSQTINAQALLVVCATNGDVLVLDRRQAARRQARCNLAVLSGVAGSLHCAALDVHGSRRVLLTGSDEKAVFSFVLLFGKPIGLPIAMPGATKRGSAVLVKRLHVAGDGRVDFVTSCGQHFCRSREELLAEEAQEVRRQLGEVDGAEAGANGQEDGGDGDKPEGERAAASCAQCAKLTKKLQLERRQHELEKEDLRRQMRKLEAELKLAQAKVVAAQVQLGA